MATSNVHIDPGGDVLTVESGGTLTAASGATVNILGSGMTATGTELSKLAGVTAGAITASKAVVVGASSEVDQWTVTAGVLTQSKTVSSAALGTVRGIHGQVTTSGTDIASGNTVGVRGLNTLSGTITAGGAFLYGCQGKLVVTGTMNHADARLCAALAQLDISAATLSAGQLSALWVDAGTTATGAGGGQFNLVRITNTTAAVPNAMIYAYGKADYFAELAANGGTWTSTTGTAGSTASKGWLKVYVEGAVRYIPLTDSVS